MQELVALFQRRMCTWQDGSAPRTVAPQKILVVRPAELCERMPAALRQALVKEYPGHRCLLLSDTGAL